MYRLWLLGVSFYLFLGICHAKAKVGLSLALSGPARLLGTSYLDGFLLYLEKHPEAPIDPVYMDDGYEPSRSMANVKFFRRMGIKIVAGETGTPTSLVILPYLELHGMILVAPFTGASFLYERFNNVFLIRASYADEVRCIINRLLERGRKKIAVFYQNDAFGKDVLNSIKKILGKRGLYPVAQGSFPRNTIDIRNAVLDITRENPEAVIAIAPYRPCEVFIKEVLRSGLKDILFCTISFTGNTFLLSSLKGENYHLLYSEVMPDINGNLPVLQNFRRDLGRRKVPLPRVEFEGYLAAMFLHRVIKGAGSSEVKDIVDYIERKQLFNLGGIKLLFGRTRRVGGRTVYLTKVVNGKKMEEFSCEAEK